MASYAIGDVQGCFDELQLLLQKIHFNEKDKVYFVGDLVNRGPQSLEVLRFIKNLPNATAVLGNHDFHLLALFYGQTHPHHTLQKILAAPDCKELIEWMKELPLLFYDEKLNYAIVHAGIYPKWDLKQALNYAKEIESYLQQENLVEFFQNIYGNKPNQWSNDLTGWSRMRFIVNAFTRMRFCTEDGKLDFYTKGKVEEAPKGYLPWFKIPSRAAKNINIAFGHWAALNGMTHQNNIFALDTGCAWGRCLTAMRLEDQQRWSVNCQKQS